MAIYNVKGNLRSECIFMEVLACVLIIPCIFGFFSGWIISEKLLGYELASGIATKIVMSTMIISIAFSTLLFRKSILIGIKAMFNMGEKNNWFFEDSCGNRFFM